MTKSNIIKIFFFMLIFQCLLPSYFVFSQDNTEDEGSHTKEEIEKLVIEKGAWLISKSEADFDTIGNTINFLLSKRVVPQAIDRNIAGEVLIISQLSPPAVDARKWTLGVYESEKEMMAGIEKEAKEYFIPTGMDVQADAAFVLYLKSGTPIVSGRLIKIKSLEEIQATINVYYDLNYLPAAISTFRNQLWIYFNKYYKVDVKNFTVIVRTALKDDTNNVLTEELSKKGVSLIDATYTIEDKVIFLFQKQI